jgi:hypothetical protein
MEIGIDFLTEKSDGEVAEILESGNRDDIRRELYPFVSGLTSGYVNDEQRSLLAWASTRALDRHRDIIEPRSFEEHLPHYRQNPIVLAAHTHVGFDAAEPTVIGKSLKEEIFPRKGLLFEPQFTDATELGEKYWRLYRDKVMQAWSVGIIPHEWERGKSTSDDEGPPPFRYRFTKVELIEISAVAVPANREALSKALQNGYEVPDEIREDLELPKGPSMVGASSKPSITEQIQDVEEKTLEISFERDPVHNTRIFTVAEEVVGELTEAIEIGLTELVRATTVRWKDETKAKTRAAYDSAIESLEGVFTND